MPAAYQDENGKWWKQCCATKELFGGVDNKEDLSEWFYKNKIEKDGFRNVCKDVDKKRQTKYHENNREKEREKSKKYYKNNREKQRERHKQYRENNKEKIKERKKEYRKNNREKVNEISKQYRKTPEGIFRRHKRSANERGINSTLTLEWFKEQMKLPEYNICAISGIQFVEEPKHPNSRSLQLIDINKPFEDGNVRWVCLYKNTFSSISPTSQQWLDYCGLPKEIGTTREVIIKLYNGKTAVVDGYDPKTNTVYEFHGDFWHGNPNRYDLNEVNRVSNKTFGQLLAETQKRSRAITSSGYNLVSIWESDWKEMQKEMAAK